MLDEENAWLYADRYAWYCHEKVPPDMPYFDDGDGNFIGRDAAYEWIVESQDTRQGRLVVMWAKNMRTPEEEAERLHRLKIVDKVNFTEGAAKLDKDPYAGFKERYREWMDYKSGRRKP